MLAKIDEIGAGNNHHYYEMYQGRGNNGKAFMELGMTARGHDYAIDPVHQDRGSTYQRGW